MKQSERQKALSAFQRLRVYQEAEGEFVKCISCGKIIHVSEADGGHYENRKNRVTELLPENVHAQCRACNRFHEGNLVAYRNGIEARYGESYAKRLNYIILASKGSSEAYSKLSDEDKRLVVSKKCELEYKVLSKGFRKELRELKKGLK
ncbi:MAG: hypothetical protein EOM67_14640 [Spirochaetia bacterium]|nr:hypothetical protein [Spirochaetia bacterium]